MVPVAAGGAADERYLCTVVDVTYIPLTIIG